MHSSLDSFRGFWSCGGVDRLLRPADGGAGSWIPDARSVLQRLPICRSSAAFIVFTRPPNAERGLLFPDAIRAACCIGLSNLHRRVIVTHNSRARLFIRAGMRTAYIDASTVR